MPPESKSDTAVIFVTDAGYLGPSVQAALQLVEQNIHSIADILIFTIDVEQDLIDLVRDRIGPSIRFLRLQDKSYLPPDGVVFTKNHVPHSALARLVISDHLPTTYQNIVYLDGDIQIVGDVRPLVRHRVREGWIAAGRGSAWLDPDDRLGLTPEKYLAALGGSSKESYFNSGVLACRRDTWANYGPKALEAFFRNGDLFIRHDQSALNATFKQNVEPLSPAYNFHHMYAEAGFDYILQPKIIHFTGPNKPWKGPVTPWGWRFHARYVDLLQRFPELEPIFKIEQPLQSRFPYWKNRYGLRTFMTRIKQRRAFRRYLASEGFAVI